MAQIGVGEREKKFLTEFKDTCSLFIPNCTKITSIQVENFYAGYGKKAGQGAGYLWGKYHICVHYQSFYNKDEIPRVKLLYRPFSFILSTAPGYQANSNTGNRTTDYFCETECDYHVTPILLSLFPVLSRLNFAPFRVVITIVGKIYSTAMNSPLKEEKDGVENYAAFEIPFLEERPPEEEPKIKVVEAESSEERKRAEGMTKGVGGGGRPVPDAKYYQTYKVFYDLLLNQPKGYESHRDM